MDNLSAFRERVIALYRQVYPFSDGHRPNQRDLAQAVGLARAELSRRLNGVHGARLSADNVRAIVRTLADWGAIQTQSGALELLSLIGVPSFSAAEWHAPPLNRLAPLDTSIVAQSFVKNNLPAPLTTFVGREKQVAAVRELLGGSLPESRMLTVIGAGGVGKSRFIIEVAYGLLGRYPDGIYLIPFSTLSDSYLVANTVAEAVCCHQEPGRSMLTTLSDYLRSRHVLLLLDNCEHLAVAVAQLVETLLSICPEVTILASSREVLGVSGETPWPLLPLTMPDLEQRPDATSLLEFEAVRLFVLRASNARPGFALTQKNAADVAQICSRLEGIPLAIELAAGLCSALDVAKIAERLDDALTLLTASSRSAPPHQQTLHASIEWSYNLLTSSERALLRRLAVFNGGWTLEAAEAVCVSGEVPPSFTTEVLTGLVALVQKSLVHTSEHGDIIRYRMLETICQYAASRLAEAGEEQEMRLRHASLYLALAEQAFDNLQGAGQVEWLNLLEDEHDNLRAALAWMLSAGQYELALRLCAALWPLWYTHGHTDEASRAVAATLEVSSGIVSSTRARVLREAGTLMMDQGNYAASRPFFEESMVISQHLEDKEGISNSLNRLAIIQIVEGNYPAARALFEQSLSLAQKIAYKKGIAAVLSNLSGLSGMTGEYSTARQLNAASLAIYEEIEDARDITGTLLNGAGLAIKQGDYSGAIVLCVRCLPLLRMLGDKPSTARCLEQLALINALSEREVKAAIMLGAADTLRESIKLPRFMEDQEYERSLSRCRAKLDENTFAGAWAQGQAMDFVQALDYAISNALPAIVAAAI